ncbi:MAG: UvrD-helicase domain-containing protein [Candidatus Omnitrophota bacterium]
MSKLIDRNFSKEPSVYIVEASAGSGKTYALAKRYVQLIMNPALECEGLPLKSILAVTFTNKATIEMKERILDFLKKIALDAFSNAAEKEDILSSLPMDRRFAGEKAVEVIHGIMNHYNFFQVQTIDSFINMLISGCAFNLGLGSDLEIKDNYRTYFEYSIDRVIDRIQSDRRVMKVFRDFLQYYLSVEGKEGWGSRRDITARLESLYFFTTTYGGPFRIPRINADDLTTRRDEIISSIEMLFARAPETTNGTFLKWIDSFVKKDKACFAVDDLSAFFQREEFPVKKNASVPDDVARIWVKLRGDIADFCEIESSAVFKPYIEIFNLVEEDFKKASAEEDVIFLQELNMRAQKIMQGASMTVAELYYRLATRFRHYLIDEFQDTSRLQWRNIFPMVHEALSSGGTLFYVGDKKQAIYRFRGGDVELFDSVRDELAMFSPVLTVLSKNYRSQKEIVKFNNSIFSERNLIRFVNELEEGRKNSTFEISDGDISAILDVFEGAEQSWKENNDSGYVRVESIGTPDPVESEAIARDKLIDAISGVRGRFDYGDIAVLARDNRDVKLFTSWLMEEKIPVESEKTLNIRENPFIKEIISFLKFLDSPIDNIAFSSFITGEIFLKAAALKPEVIHGFLFSLRPKSPEEDRVYIYKEFIKSFPGQWGRLIDGFFKNAGFVPLYEFVITVFSEFNVMSAFPEYHGFFMKFLEIIKRKEGEYEGISSFLSLFESIEDKNLYVNVSDTDSVKVTTIHKSKGLEYPVVIIPFFEMAISVGAGGRKRPYVLRQWEDGTLSLVQLKKKYGLYSEVLRDEYRKEYIRSLIGELNTLYVALTRAEYELYVFVPETAGSGANAARLLLPFDDFESGEKAGYSRKRTADGVTAMDLPVSHYSGWINVLKSESLDLSELVNRRSILRGEALHFILSCIGNLRDTDREACFRALDDKVRRKFPNSKDLGEYLNTAKKMVASKGMERFFYVPDGQVFQEKEIVDSFGKTGRIDRLVLSPGEAWVIDFKSSDESKEEQKKQVSGYMRVIEQLYPERVVKGFLLYFDTFTAEEV